MTMDYGHEKPSPLFGISTPKPTDFESTFFTRVLSNDSCQTAFPRVPLGVYDVIALYSCCN